MQPVDRRIQLHVHALADDLHIWLANFDLLSFNVLAEEDGELVEEDLAHSQAQLLFLPGFEERVQLRHISSIASNRLLRNFLVNLHVSMVKVAKDSHGVAFEIRNGPQ